MIKSDYKIRFKAILFRPPATAKVGSSTLLTTLPKKASAKLPSQGTTTVEGTINGFPFPRAKLEPDGQGSHWLRVIRNMREAAGVNAGDIVAMEIVPASDEPEPKVPADLRRALAATPKARTLWSDITPIARRDWVLWIESAKQAETRARRVDGACAMLAKGKRRVCCFDSYKARMEQLSRSEPERSSGVKKTEGTKSRKTSR